MNNTYLLQSNGYMLVQYTTSKNKAGSFDPAFGHLSVTKYRWYKLKKMRLGQRITWYQKQWNKSYILSKCDYDYNYSEKTGTFEEMTKLFLSDVPLNPYKMELKLPDHKVIVGYASVNASDHINSVMIRWMYWAILNNIGVETVEKIMNHYKEVLKQW